MKKKIIFVAIPTVLFFNISVADVFPMDWSDKSTLSVATDSVYHDTKWYIHTIIGHNTVGKAKIYIRTMKMINNKAADSCKEEDPAEINKKILFKINNQNIMGFRYCKKLNNSEITRYEITPATSTGDKFLINAMKSSKNFVAFEYDTITSEISTIGFSKAWEKSGNDAL